MSPGAVRERIEAISRQEHNDLIRFIRQYTRSSAVAEEILQEAYLEALKCAERIEYPEKLLSWLKTVARRLAFKEIEKQDRMIKKCKYYLIPEFVSLEDRIIERLVLVTALSKILRNSPPYYATVIHYRYYYGMP